MKTSLHRILTEDKIELVGLLYEPETPTEKILVHVHGMAGNFYENLFLDFIAKTLTDQGIAFFTFNNRGCELIKDLRKIRGNKRTIVRIGNTFEKFEDCLLDIEAAVRFIKSRSYMTIHLSGHSLGAPKVAYYAALKGSDLASVIFLSPPDMVGSALKEKSFEMEYDTAKKMIADCRGKKIMPGIIWGDAYLSANTYMSLSDKRSKVAIFNLYDPEDKLELLGKIKIPAYTIMGKKDVALIILIEETMERIKRAMANSPRVETNILGDADHGYNGYEQRLADALREWIKNSSSSLNHYTL